MNLIGLSGHGMGRMLRMWVCSMMVGKLDHLLGALLQGAQRNSTLKYIFTRKLDYHALSVSVISGYVLLLNKRCSSSAVEMSEVELSILTSTMLDDHVQRPVVFSGSVFTGGCEFSIVVYETVFIKHC